MSVHTATLSSSLHVIVLAAGKGTRMRSATPKVMHTLVGKSMLAWVLEQVSLLNPVSINVVVGHEGYAVERHVREKMPSVHICWQKEQLGTGHAVHQVLLQSPAFQNVNNQDRVLIVCGDTPLIQGASLQTFVQRALITSSSVCVGTTENAQSFGYGRIIRDDNHRVQSIVEEKNATETQKKITEVNTGMYVVAAPYLKDVLTTLQPNLMTGEIYLTDIVEDASRRSLDVEACSFVFDETLGVNDRVQLSHAQRILQNRILDTHMKNGVTMLDPATTYIESTVILSEDVVLEPMVSLRGKTSVGRNTIIKQGSILVDTIVEDDVVIHPYTVTEKAHVGRRAVVGPFARLRPETRLMAESHVGNFVELKKTTLGKNSKANHLAYLGDSTIGDGCNIGAGTITCNYDGIKKHPTLIDDGVFVGSNSTLVAPVHIQKESYIAAGSVITKNVPSNSLAVARTRQENKEGYVARLKARQKGS